MAGAPIRVPDGCIKADLLFYGLHGYHKENKEKSQFQFTNASQARPRPAMQASARG